MTVAKIWNGSSWVTPSGFNVPRAWNGTTWVNTRPRYWNGSHWGKIDSPFSRTITVGFAGPGSWGFRDAGFGSISGTNNNLLFYNGIIVDLYWSGFLFGNGQLIFSLKSDEEIVTNSRWNELTVNGVSYLRSGIQNFNFQGSANQRGGTGSWTWPVEVNPPFTQTIGATNTISFT